MMNSTHQSHTHHENGDKEFSFWCSSNTISSQNDQLGDNKTFTRNHFNLDHSPYCSKAFDPSRRKAIAEGQKELMEMVQDMPECSYELSFQDMVVVEKQVLEPEPKQSETSLDNTLIMQSNTAQSKKKSKMKKNKSNNKGQIMRVESMDHETFLLKLFFPTSFDWMKKAKVKNGSKVSPRTPFQESIKQVGKEWRIKRLFLAGDNKSDAEDGISQSTSDKNRYIAHSFSFSLGCWPLFPNAKSKTK